MNAISMGVGFIVAMLLYTQAVRPAIDHRVWKEIRAQQFWSDSGLATTRTFRITQSGNARAQVCFSVAHAKEMCAEANRFTVFTLADGLRIAADGSASRIGPRQADWWGIWLLKSGEIGYVASWQTSDVKWKPGEKPPAVRLPPPMAATPIRDMGIAGDDGFDLTLSEMGQARLSFVMSDISTSLSAAAFAIASGRDGVHVISSGRATLVKPSVTDGIAVEGIELWMSPGGGVAYRTLPKSEQK
jgi:hypothetical protein